MPAQNPQTTTYAYRQRSKHFQCEYQEKLYQYKKRFKGEGAVETTVYYTKYHFVGAAPALAAIPKSILYDSTDICRPGRVYAAVTTSTSKMISRLCPVVTPTAETACG